MIKQLHNKVEYAQLLHDDAVRISEAAHTFFNQPLPCTVADAVQHFNNGGSVVVRTRGHNVLYAKLWESRGHTEAVLTSAIQESDSFNCVGGFGNES